MFAIEQFVPFAAIFSLAIFTQSATGFASGLVVIPLMVWAGHGIPEAQAALLVSTLMQNGWGAYQYRETIQFREVVPPASLRLVALPVGVGALFMIDGFPTTLLRQIVGAVVVFCVLLLLIFRPKPKERVHPGWVWLAFPTSGFFQGCTGTGGPMMVLWVQSHDWSTRRTRAFLFVMYLVTIVPAWLLLFYCFGTRMLEPSLAAIVIIPLLFAATWLGLRVGTWLGRHRLRSVTMGLLLVIGMTSIFSPMLAQPIDHQDTEGPVEQPSNS